jgi:hypothetical protein
MAEHKNSQADEFKDKDEKRREERLKKAAQPAQPAQPGPAKKVGDETPNPLPDHPREDESAGGGDPGRE